MFRRVRDIIFNLGAVSDKRRIEIIAMMIAREAGLDKADPRHVQKRFTETLLSIFEAMYHLNAEHNRLFISRGQMAAILRSVARKIDPPHPR